MKFINSSAILIVFLFQGSFCLNNVDSFYKFSISTTYLSLGNIESGETNVHMYEIHFGFKLSPKDKLEIKACTWKLFEPMGIPLWDTHFMKKSEWYPGKIHEYGIGLGYQRMLWKHLFASIEILPLKKVYLDKNSKQLDDGFKLYTSYHLGYHFSFFNNRIFLEPQVHCNYWPIDTKGPKEFEEKERNWNSYFLFEPNLFFGVEF